MRSPQGLALDSARPSTLLPLGACLLLCLGAAAPAASQPAAPDRPNILFVTIDTLRPDAVGWVSGIDTTPHFDSLAAAGVAFPTAVAPAPLTLPAHASMFSGLIPRRHGVRDNHQVVGPAPPLLAELLAAAGYSTAAVVSGFPLSAQFGLHRGFDHFDDRLTAGEGAWLERPAAETAAAALSWLAEASGPWFLWVHFYDPHFPYEPPSAFERPGRRGGYDGEVAAVDHELGRLLQAARSAGQDLLTVVTGDHGEALGEHGEGTHGFFVYDDTILVPLVLHWPTQLEAQRSEAAVRLIDIGPTVLDLLALPEFADSDGASLRPLMLEGVMEGPVAYVETLQPWHSYGWAPLAAVRDQGWKLIAAPSPELYDLDSDPGETENLFGQGRSEELVLRRQLRTLEARPSAAGASVADPEALANLRALGYLGAPSSGPIPDRASLPDPKAQLALRELLTAGDDALRAGRFTPALESFRQALGRDPGNRFAQTRLGLALLGLGRAAEARIELDRAVELAPEDPEARAAFADLLTRSGEPAAAVPHWFEVVRLQPGRAEAWSHLGTALGMSGQAARAVAAYRRAADLEPEDPARWTRLAFASVAGASTHDAVLALERAAALTPGEEFAHAGALGLLLLRDQRPDEAEPWLRRSRPAEAEFPQARLSLVRRLLESGRRDEARGLLEESVRLRPEIGPQAAADQTLRGLLSE